MTNKEIVAAESFAMSESLERFTSAILNGDQAVAIAILRSDLMVATARLTHHQLDAIYPAIIVATIADMDELVQAMIDCGANTETVWEEQGWRTLHFAARENCLAAARVLLNEGAAPDVGDHQKKTPLFWAVVRRHLEMADLLLSAGACVDQRWKDGLSLLHHESKDGKNETVEFLLNHGADCNIRDDRGQAGSTPLHGAARHNRVKTARLLITHGADINAETDLGQTPLDAARRSQHQKIVDLLIESGARTANKPV